MIKLNGSEVCLSEEDKSTLRKFFDSNIEWINNNDLLAYDNIKTFGDMYENYVDENGFRDNDVLMLFLAEVRYSQLVYKTKKDTLASRIAKMSRPSSSNGVHIQNGIVSKWYRESLILEEISPVAKTELNSIIQPLIEQNALVQKESWTEVAKTIIKN